MRRIFYICAAITMFASCIRTPDARYITGKLWQHSRGMKAGSSDFIRFDPDFAILTHDTIIVKNVPAAIVTDLEYKSREMSIRSLTSDSTGIYINVEDTDEHNM